MLQARAIGRAALCCRAVVDQVGWSVGFDSGFDMVPGYAAEDGVGGLAVLYKYIDRAGRFGAIGNPLLTDIGAFEENPGLLVAVLPLKG